MGIIDRLVNRVNAAAEPIQNAVTPRDRSLVRGDELERSGEATEGTVVGVAYDVNDQMNRCVYAIEVAHSTGESRRFAVHLTQTRELHLMRLGLRVPVRLDGGGGVVDWSALAAAAGVASTAPPSQRTRRKVPDDGVSDSALTWDESRSFKKGERTTATITDLEWVTTLGMRTYNWTITLRGADGSTLVSPKAEVPAYAWWLAVVGAEVPVALDPKKAGTAWVDWAAVANAAAGRPVSLADRPPAGSIAEQVLSDRAAEPQTPVSGIGDADTRETITANRDAAMVTGTLADWASEVQAGRMKPKAFLKYVAEWEEAGMCTAAEADAARRSVGL